MSNNEWTTERMQTKLTELKSVESGAAKPVTATASASTAAAPATAAGGAAPQKLSPVWVVAKPFVLGAISGITATCCIQPIDLVKVRLQLSGEGGGAVIKSPFTMAKLIYKAEGPLAFYQGLSAGILRQLTYGCARLGIFKTVNDRLADPKTGKATAGQSAIAGLLAGGLGSVIGTPADLALIRMQSDSTLPAAQRRGYKNVGDALTRIVKEEGVTSLWKGNLPTVTRAIAMNVGMLATFEQSKQLGNEYFGPGRASNFMASMVGGFFGSAAALPFDFLKTRLQKQKAGPDGKLPYAGFIDCATKVVRTEGPLAFYKGFATFYFRIAPHTIIALNVLEYLNDAAKKKGL